jgi:hypothetical protein
MNDEELKREEIEVSHTLGGGRVQGRGIDKKWRCPRKANMRRKADLRKLRGRGGRASYMTGKRRCLLTKSYEE